MALQGETAVYTCKALQAVMVRSSHVYRTSLSCVNKLTIPANMYMLDLSHLNYVCIDEKGGIRPSIPLI